MAVHAGQQSPHGWRRDLMRQKCSSTEEQMNWTCEQTQSSRENRNKMESDN